MRRLKHITNHDTPPVWLTPWEFYPQQRESKKDCLGTIWSNSRDPDNHQLISQCASSPSESRQLQRGYAVLGLRARLLPHPIAYLYMPKACVEVTRRALPQHEEALQDRLSSFVVKARVLQKTAPQWAWRRLQSKATCFGSDFLTVEPVIGRQISVTKWITRSESTLAAGCNSERSHL